MFSSLSPGRKIILQLAVVLGLCATALIIIMILTRLNPVTNSHQVRFEVEASGGFAVITLQAGPVLISKPATITVPWSKTVQLSTGTEIYLTASNPTQTGKITCRITLDGQAWKEESAVAPKSGVACAGIVP
jgi:hypothetical protein